MVDAYIEDRLSRLTLKAESRNGSGLEVDEGEEVMKEQPSVALSVDSNGSGNTLGKVFLTTRRIVWISDDESACKSCSIDLLAVVIHAQASASEGRDGGIYLQVEQKAEEGEAASEDLETLELVLTPRDQSSLSALFSTLCDCVAMNPDQGYLDLDEEEGGEEGASASFEIGHAVGVETEKEDLQELLENKGPERFADA
jgi:hypothetical protein